jgi:hypothetical protein
VGVDGCRENIYAASAPRPPRSAYAIRARNRCALHARAKLGDRFALLSSWWLVPRTSGIQREPRFLALLSF